jgi:hypothetical protein
VKIAGLMAVISLSSWLLVAAFVDRPAAIAVFFGMLGPLIVAAVTWPLMERTYTRRPDALTPLMMAGFAGKLVFFGAYVAVMLSVLALDAVPFVAGFVCYFSVLHLIEALSLRRLFRRAAGAPG